MSRLYSKSVVMQSAAVATGNGTVVDVAGFATLCIQLSGTMTNLVVTFEATADGTNWVAVQVVNANTGGLSTTATAAGLYVMPCAGFSQVRARVSTWVAGDVTAVGMASTAGEGLINAVYSALAPQTPTAYRSALAATDTVALPGTITCTKQANGSCTAGTYYVRVTAINAFGRTTAVAGNVTVTTETTNLTVRAAFAQVTGATHYGIYCSRAADPLWVGRITEAQRASGILITAVGVTGAGGTAGAVDIQIEGTGLAATVSNPVNTAYVIPASPINCTGYSFVDFDLTAARTGDVVAAALSVQSFFKNTRNDTWYGGQVVALAFGSLKQRLRVECRGNAAAALLITAIAGTGMSVEMDAVLS